jgi:hypothetical protein
MFAPRPPRPPRTPSAVPRAPLPPALVMGTALGRPAPRPPPTLPPRAGLGVLTRALMMSSRDLSIISAILARDSVGLISLRQCLAGWVYLSASWEQQGGEQRVVEVHGRCFPLPEATSSEAVAVR